ncbi:Hvo_1808 family surface protein [Halostagnicola sp. A-GB9-2]|uniref:Hvo_1808 family surface protein n=1 Tax=Halostagnicola sp. A-GB9-2 TaxID=3048066 RepID=UPI0024BF7269|nr:Hvo_1808 family surface protein [Halostagnicola sp. A-GB9-2]MDJ1431372.1 Hvo_1808 family surface protein [Halostagnicola sp. A-GB9-2]
MTGSTPSGPSPRSSPPARSRRLGLVAIAVLIVLSGCTLPFGPSGPEQFDTDRDLGYVGEYAYDDILEIDDPAALSEAELEALKYRSMARIEVVREQKFEHDVSVEVVSRDEFRERSGVIGSADPASPATNELWRGAFVVDGDTDVNDALEELYGDSVQGYYSADRIVIVTDDTDEIRIDRTTLVHELVHALQDQQFGLEREGKTADEQRAENALIEGEANYVPHLYDQRCGSAWECLPDSGAPDDPDGPDEPVGQPSNIGLFLSIYAPYSEGPTFVESLHERYGWEAVDEAYENRPVSTSQVIHPELYPDTEPVTVEVPDRSSSNWEPATDDDGGPHVETVGEATLFASLWANGVIDRPIDEGVDDGQGAESDGTAPLSPYNYSHPTTDGWAGDSFVAYQDRDAEDDRLGHVWHLEWDSDTDAERFANAYVELLENHDAAATDADESTATDDGGQTYLIDDGPFEGAYHAAVVDDRVEIVAAPTVGELAEVHDVGSVSNTSITPASERSPVAVGATG